jgi:hypothetical protein
VRRGDGPNSQPAKQPGGGFVRPGHYTTHQRHDKNPIKYLPDLRDPLQPR